MSNQILMPELSPTMTAGIVSRWLVSPGEVVNIGDVIAEIETDKVTVEYESPIKGVVQEIFVTEGATDVAVGTLLATFSQGAEHQAITTITAKKNDEIKSPGASVIPPTVATHMQATRDKVAEKLSPSQQLVQDIQSNIRISPIARRMAYQADVDINSIVGSGERGEITKEDIRAALGINASPSSQQVESPAIVQFVPNTQLLPPHTEISLSRMRKTVAQRLAASSQFIPHFYMSVDCHIDVLLKLREEINQRYPQQAKLSLNDFVIKAVASALKQVPEANVMWNQDKILQFAEVDIAIAVAIDDGLITPVITRCWQKGLREISQQSAELVAKAKSGKLKPNEFQGGTFTISNLGMFGINNFTSIINPPQSGILSVGAAQARPSVINGELAISNQMTITLAMDHRCVDGVTGAKLINRIQAILQNPMELIL